jgi:phage/plasmid primase-like uncharacterized protein
MNAEAIAKRLGGRKSGDGWTARCPAHADSTPSLSIRDSVDGRVLVHCFACCSQARVIAALKSMWLWEESADRRYTRPIRHAFGHNQLDRDDAQRTEVALAIWQASVPANNTLIATYLASRGIHLPPPPTLRFIAGLKHRSGETWPAMVGLVIRGTDDTPTGIHRTYLARDGNGKAPVEPRKMMLGKCSSGAVRLAHAEGEVLIGEGIETVLAVMQATARPGWAALSAPGLRSLQLPATIQRIIVLADGDQPGEDAATFAAARWVREGRHVEIARPPRGLDFNDMLLGGAFHRVEGAA